MSAANKSGNDHRAPRLPVGRPALALMTGLGDAPVPLGDALERLLGSIDAPPVDLLSTVFQRWEEVVGPEVARHCRPAAIEGERLVVLASDATWASEVQWLASAVLARINEMSTAGRLESLTVQVAPAT